MEHSYRYDIEDFSRIAARIKFDLSITKTSRTDNAVPVERLRDTSQALLAGHGLILSRANGRYYCNLVTLLNDIHHCVSFCFRSSV